MACTTDRVDARVLAELCRRDLVAALWIPSLEERELRERLRRRMHLVRLGTSAMNWIFGLGTQWGLRLSAERLRRQGGFELLARSGVPAVWQRSIEEALAVIELLDARIAPLEAELAPLARADRDVALLVTIPGVGELLALWAAVEAAQHAWRESNPWHQLYSDVGKRRDSNAAKSAVARKVLIASWHILSRQQPFKPSRPRGGARTVPASSISVLPPDGPRVN